MNTRVCLKHFPHDCAMIKSRLCNHHDPYILVKGAITIVGEGADAATRAAVKLISK